MSLIDDVPQATGSAAALDLDALNDAAWASTDVVVLELCRLVIARALGDERGLERRTPQALELGLDEEKVAALVTWWTSPLFSVLEKDCLGFAEQFVMSVDVVSDQQVEALLANWSPVEVYAFATAIYVVEFVTRLDMVSRALDQESV